MAERGSGKRRVAAASKPKPAAKGKARKAPAARVAKPTAKKAAAKVTANDPVEKKDPGIEAVSLLKTGKTIEQIAATRRLGFKSESDVLAAIRRVLQQEHHLPVAEAHRLELERLDALQAALWPEAMKGKHLAVDRILQISERRARLLGLDEYRPPEEKPKDGIDEIAKKRASRRAAINPDGVNNAG